LFFSFSFLVLWTNLFLHHPQKCKTMVSDRAPLKERYPLFLSKAKTYHVDGGSYVYNAWWIMCVSKFDWICIYIYYIYIYITYIYIILYYIMLYYIKLYIILYIHNIIYIIYNIHYTTMEGLQSISKWPLHLMDWGHRNGLLTQGTWPLWIARSFASAMIWDICPRYSKVLLLTNAGNLHLVCFSNWVYLNI
jgi:hypothetical protein